MKKIIIMALSVLLVASMTACGDKKETTVSVGQQEPTTTEQAPLGQAPTQQAQAQPEAPTQAPAEQVTTEAPVDPSAGDASTGKFEKFSIVYKSAKIIDADGKKVLALTFDFTNLDTENKSFAFSTSVKGFQNGIEVENDTLFNEQIDYGTGQKELQTGATLEVYDYLVLSDLTSPVDIEISPIFSFDNSEVYKMTIDPSTLPS